MNQPWNDFLRRTTDAAAEEEAAARERQRPPNGRADDARADSPAALDFIVASSLPGLDPPKRPWLVEHWVPRRQVTLLTGDGGTGKSLLAEQFLVASAAGRRWLGLPTAPCRAIGFFAEDDSDELHRRLAAIAETERVEIGALDNLALRSALADECELVELDEHGRPRPTTYWAALVAAVRSFGARLVVLDAAQNFYGGDEIRRRQVNAFLVLLRRLAMEIDGAVVLIAHPSVHGISSGSGISGSTAWNNSVRSRLYFVRATGDEADPDERTLTRLKPITPAPATCCASAIIGRGTPPLRASDGSGGCGWFDQRERTGRRLRRGRRGRGITHRRAGERRKLLRGNQIMASAFNNKGPNYCERVASIRRVFGHIVPADQD